MEGPHLVAADLAPERAGFEGEVRGSQGRGLGQSVNMRP